MARKKKVPDSVSAKLDYDLSVMMSTHIEESDEYQSRAEFIRDAMIEKLKRDCKTTDVLEYYIQEKQKEIDEIEKEKQAIITRYKRKKKKLKNLRKEKERLVKKETTEFFDKLKKSNY